MRSWKAAQKDYAECCGCVSMSMTIGMAAVGECEGGNIAAQVGAFLDYGSVGKPTCMTSSLDHHIHLPDLLVGRNDCFRSNLWTHRLLAGLLQDADVAVGG